MNFQNLINKKMWFVFLIISSFVWSSAKAQNQSTICATLIYHFAKYTQFPATGNTVLTIGIMGKSDLNHDALALTGKTVGSAQIQVKEINEVSEISSCNIVFVPGKLSGKYQEIVSKAKDNHVLLISDSPDACKAGVAINFYEEGTKVRFEISNKNAQACGLKISNDLQKLGKVID